MIEAIKRHKSIWLVVLFVASLLLPMVVRESYQLHIVNITYIYIILALSLGIIIGFIGELSLGHAAFFGIGAYASALMTKDLGLSFWVAFPLATIGTATVGLLLGYPALRLKGHSFSITTLALGEVVRLLINNLQSVTRGPLGLPGIKPPQFFNIDLYDRRAFYYILLFFVVASVVFVYRLIYSRVGRAFVAVREDDVLAKSIGVHVMRYKIMAFVIASGMAAVAGCLYAHYILFISPDTFNLPQSINLVLMVIIGGSQSIVGPIIGAFLITSIPEILRAVAEYRMVTYGAVLIFAIVFMPRGIVGTIKDRFESLGQKSITE